MTYIAKDHHHRIIRNKKNWGKHEEEAELLFLCPFIKNLSVVEIIRNQRKYIFTIFFMFLRLSFGLDIIFFFHLSIFLLLFAN